jgi:hypothetical protein
LTSIESLKRNATAIGRSEQIPHWEALNRAAHDAGFENYTHARHLLESGEAPLPPGSAFPDRPPSMLGLGRDAFLAACRAAWSQSLDLLAGDWEQRVFTGPHMLTALQRIVGHTRSHTHLPTGGGMDFQEIRPATEPRCLEFQVERGAVYLARPARLVIQRLPLRPAESFALLELADLAPSGVYPPRDDDSPHGRREEVVDLGGGDYRDRAAWDDGFLDYDAQGREIPLPDAARLVVRWFNGKMLFVTKGSLWNGTSATYDGRHDAMNVADIRAMIEAGMH